MLFSHQCNNLLISGPVCNSLCKQASIKHFSPHLAKCPSDVKQNGTQDKTPFSVFLYSLPYPFTWCAWFCCECQLQKPLNCSDCLSKNFNQPVRRCYLAKTCNKTDHEKGAENCVRKWVLFQCTIFRSHGRFERCAAPDFNAGGS